MRWDQESADNFANSDGDLALLGLLRCLAACVALGGEGGRRARQEGPAEAVEPGVGSGSSSQTKMDGVEAAGDASGQANEGSGSVAGGGADDDEGEYAEGVEAAPAEEGEYCAAIENDEMVDLDRSWKKVLVGMQKSEMLVLEKGKVEASMRQMPGWETYESHDLARRAAEAAKEAQEAAKKCSGRVEAIKKRLEKTEQEIQATCPPPGVAASLAAGGRGGDAPGVDVDGGGGGGCGGGGGGRGSGAGAANGELGANRLSRRARVRRRRGASCSRRGGRPEWCARP